MVLDPSPPPLEITMREFLDDLIFRRINAETSETSFWSKVLDLTELLLYANLDMRLPCVMCECLCVYLAISLAMYVSFIGLFCKRDLWFYLAISLVWMPLCFLFSRDVHRNVSQNQSSGVSKHAKLVPCANIFYKNTIWWFVYDFYFSRTYTETSRRGSPVQPLS